MPREQRAETTWLKENEEKLYRKACGFTMIEMMVVILIMAILLGMGVVAMMPLMGTTSVQAAAQKLQAALLTARSLAAKYNGIYGVVFNVWYSNGLYMVLDDDNQKASHWYAIVGPNATTGLCNVTLVDGPTTDTDYQNRFNEMKDRQVGPRYPLPDQVMFNAAAHQLNSPPGRNGKIGWDRIDIASPGGNAGTRTSAIRFLPNGQALLTKVFSQMYTNYTTATQTSFGRILLAAVDIYSSDKNTMVANFNAKPWVYVKVNQYTGMVTTGKD